MAYKFNLMRGNLMPATPQAAYGLQGLRPPPVSVDKFETTRIIWSQGPDTSNVKNLLQHRAILEKSNALCHLKGHIDSVVYKPTMVFLGSVCLLASYKLYRLAFLM